MQLDLLQRRVLHATRRTSCNLRKNHCHVSRSSHVTGGMTLRRAFGPAKLPGVVRDAQWVSIPPSVALKKPVRGASSNS